MRKFIATLLILSLCPVLSADGSAELEKYFSWFYLRTSFNDPDLKRTIQSNGNEAYGTDGKEFYYSVDKGKTWKKGGEGLPRKVIYPFVETPLRLVNGMTVDPKDPKKVALSFETGVYVSIDGGLNFKKLAQTDTMARNFIFTSFAFAPDGSYWFGSAFQGIYSSIDAGITWTELAAMKYGPLYDGGGFVEDIGALTFFPDDTDSVYLVAYFNRGIYRWSRSKGTLTPVKVDIPGELVMNIFARDLTMGKKDNGVWTLEIETDNAYWYYDRTSGAVIRKYKKPEAAPADAEKIKRLAISNKKNVMYVTSYSAMNIATHLDVAVAKGFNAMVIDFKDDEGVVAYNTALTEPYRIGAVKQRINAQQLIKQVHDKGIYLIARVVVFKDPYLYRADSTKLAIWDSLYNTSWGNKYYVTDEKTGAQTLVQKEYWVDPYSEAVWKYNLDIAKELQDLGVDEIQFDYIRFPTDGPTSRCYYRFAKPNMTKTDAMESFLKQARSLIVLPVSVDLYGYASWYRMGPWMGQSVEIYAPYVDIISPMFYPNHFLLDFRKINPYADWAHFIYKEGTMRTKILCGRDVSVRPWVQSFLMLSFELAMEEPAYELLLKRQIEGSYEAGGCGVLLWNASNKYYMVVHPLSTYIPAEHK